MGVTARHIAHLPNPIGLVNIKVASFGVNSRGTYATLSRVAKESVSRLPDPTKWYRNAPLQVEIKFPADVFDNLDVMIFISKSGSSWMSNDVWSFEKGFIVSRRLDQSGLDQSGLDQMCLARQQKFYAQNRI